MWWARLKHQTKLAMMAAQHGAGALKGLSDTNARNIVTYLPKRKILDAFADDPWLQNKYLNLWENETGAAVLDSYPTDVTLPIADVCNARCTFCTAWLSGSKFMKPEDVERYVELLRYAHTIGIQGHGEPLANPHIDKILTRIGEVIDPRASSYIITNGIYLKRCFDALKRARVSTFNFSLNATSQDVHQRVMGLGPNGFETVMDSVRLALDYREREDPSAWVTISLVITRDNVHQMAEFVRLGNALKVNTVYLRSLMPIGTPLPGLNYQDLPPILHPEFDQHVAAATTEIARSEVPVQAQPETWAHDVVPPAVRERLKTEPRPSVQREDALKDPALREFWRGGRPETGRGEKVGAISSDGENPYGRKAPFPCRFIYRSFISTAMNFQVVPCCYMPDVPGYNRVIFDGERPAKEYWNSEAFVALRRSLKQGPLMDPCKRCPMQGQ